MSPEESLQFIHAVASKALQNLEFAFPEGTLLTLIARCPGSQDRDFVCSADDTGEAIKVLQRRQAGEVRGEISEAEVNRAITELERRNEL